MVRRGLPKWIVTVTLLTVRALSGGEPVRLFVEPFGNKPGGSELRGALVNTLQKNRSLTLTGDASSAQLILAGSGETYIKGYLGTNPRVRYLNSDARPVYGGFLSVELKNREHDTIWSYLVTPRRFGSEDINRNLAGQIVRKLTEAIEAQRKPSKP
jgi:hypothetical protein